MTRSQQIAEEIGTKNGLLAAIVAKGAEATDEEFTSAETLIAEIEGLEGKRAAALALESKAADAAALAHRLSTEKATSNVKHVAPQPPAAAPPASPGVPVAVAPKAYTGPVFRGQLNNFKGETAAADAYAFGMWFKATLKDEKATEWCKEHGIEVKLHAEGVNSAGGYLVPHQFENMLIDLREEYGVFRRNAKIVPMTSDTRSDPRRTGGLTAYPIGEGATITESTKGWDRVNLTAKKIGTLAKVTSELSEDAVINVADDLAGEIAYAFAKYEDDAGFIGDGTSTYSRIVGVAPSLLALSATRANIAGLVVGTGNLFSELLLGDFNAVKARLPQYAFRRGPKWYASQAFYYGVMEKLAVAAGGVTEQGIAAGAGTPRFLGFPVEIAQSMPQVDANDQVACLFGVLSLAARFGDRRQTTIALSEHTNFAEDELVIRGTQRFDINVHDVGNAHATAASRVPGPIVGLLMAAA